MPADSCVRPRATRRRFHHRDHGSRGRRDVGDLARRRLDGAGAAQRRSPRRAAGRVPPGSLHDPGARANHRGDRARRLERPGVVARGLGRTLRRRGAAAPGPGEGRAEGLVLHRVARPNDLARTGPRHLAAGRSGGGCRARRGPGGERLPLARCGGRRPGGALAFDTGPGVGVVDAVTRRIDPAARFDAGGERARRGKPSRKVLDALLADPYYAAPPPKSTGRELFSPEYAARLLDDVRRVGGSDNDAVATATALTVETIARGIERSE